MKSPFVIDLHCDLLSYLNHSRDADPFKAGEIGCSFPALKTGNVGLQVLAIFTTTENGSTESGLKQSQIFKNLYTRYEDQLSLITETAEIDDISASPRIGIMAAIENASGFCEEDESLDMGLERLEEIIKNTQRVLYIILTHHQENRFGGGNYSKAGLKEDGKVVLDNLDGRKIAIDLSHTSDALAHDILDYLSLKGLDVPVIASHSNFRTIWDHPRNLTDDVAKEIIQRKGIIGINFLRAFLNNDYPDAIYEHIEHGLKLGGENAISFGADYFYTKTHPDQSRVPFYFPQHESAECYPSILENLSAQFSREQAECISCKNASNYIKRIWK